MQQRRLTLVLPMFGLVLVAASTSNVNAVSCIAKPNGQPPQGQHWFYRTDRVTHRQCWYLAPQNADAQKSATKQLSGTRKLPAAPRHAQRPTAAAPQVAHAASAAATDVPPRATAALAEAAKLPDVPPSFAAEPQPTLAESSRSADATSPVLAPATDDAEEPQSPVNAQTSQVATAAQAPVEAPSSLIVVTLALLTMVGPVFHAARWLRRRKASNRGLGQAGPVTVLPRTSTPDSDSETAARYIPPPQPLKQAEKEVALALQQLLNETQTKSNVESLDQKEQLAQELQQLLNDAQTKQRAKARGQTEQLAEALNTLRDRASQRVQRHHGQLASEEEPLRSRDLLLANQRN
jgi:hypothetical protein